MFFLVGILKSTALYGLFSLLITLFLFHISLKSIRKESLQSTKTFISSFYKYMLWSPIALVLLIMLHFIIVNILYGDTIIEYLHGFIGRFIGTFTNPWRGLVSLVGASAVIDSFDLYGLYVWVEVIIHFVWAVALFAFIGIGFYKIAKRKD